MTLKDFVAQFIEHNSMIRLVYKTKDGHVTVEDSWDSVFMAYTVLADSPIAQLYGNVNVVGICSILCINKYVEAINIVIESEITNHK